MPKQAKRVAVSRVCRTPGCSAVIDRDNDIYIVQWRNSTSSRRRYSRRRYSYCARCRHQRRRELRRIQCQTPAAARATTGCCRIFEILLSDAEFAETKIAKNRYCQACRDFVGGGRSPRFRALQLQTERGQTIYEIIEEAGRQAGTSIRHRGMSHGSVIRRFHTALGVNRMTLHNWLRFFYGLAWPDWKRRFICRGKSCSIVDVSRVTSRSPYAKYLPVIQLRQSGVCSCPILGDNLVLVDRSAEALALPQLTRDGFRARWTREIAVLAGPHQSLLNRQDTW